MLDELGGYELPTLPEAPPDDMFVSLEQQLANVREWNEMRHWGFEGADFNAIDLTPRTTAGLLEVDVIAVYLKGKPGFDPVRHTADDLWLLASMQQPNSWCWDLHYWDQPDSGLKPVKLVEGIVHRPGIRRVTLDLAANWRPDDYVRPIHVLSPRAAHAEVLAAAAHFPKWVRAMDGHTVPYAWLAGYQVTLPRNSAHYRLPCLSWTRYRQTLSLASHEAAYSHRGWAAPVCVS